MNISANASTSDIQTFNSLMSCGHQQPIQAVANFLLPFAATYLMKSPLPMMLALFFSAPAVNAHSIEASLDQQKLLLKELKHKTFILIPYDMTSIEFAIPNFSKYSIPLIRDFIEKTFPSNSNLLSKNQNGQLLDIDSGRKSLVHERNSWSDFIKRRSQQLSDLDSAVASFYERVGDVGEAFDGLKNTNIPKELFKKTILEWKVRFTSINNALGLLVETERSNHHAIARVMSNYLKMGNDGLNTNQIKERQDLLTAITRTMLDQADQFIKLSRKIKSNYNQSLNNVYLPLLQRYFVELITV